MLESRRVASAVRRKNVRWGMMEFEDIERILELVRQHDLAEFEVEQDGLKLRVRKASAVIQAPPPMPPAAVPAPPPPAHVAPAPAPPVCLAVR